MKKVDVNELRKVAVEYRSDVDALTVVNQARELYKAIKLFGIENVTTTYWKEDFIDMEKSGHDISTRVRAIAAIMMMHELQMNDSATSVDRLEKHFGDISIEASIGYRFGNKKINLTSKSNEIIIKEYLGDKQISLKEKKNRVWIKSLYDLIVLQKDDIDLWHLWTECEKLYQTVVAVGLKNTTCWIRCENLKELSFTGSEIPERIRAFCLFVMVHMYRMNDDEAHMQMLSERFELRAVAKVILGDTDIFKDKSDNHLKCISLKQIVGRYLKKREAGEWHESPITLQLPFDAIETQRFDTESETMVELLWTALDALYKTTKIIGIDNVNVRYVDANKKMVVQSGRNVPEKIRAFSEEAVIYMYRMNDSDASRARLEAHFALSASSKVILGNTNVISCSKSMPCISFKKLIERYFENSSR